MRRLFIAIEIPDEIKASISDSIATLKNKFKGNFVQSNKLHITLLFLGDPELPTDHIADIVRDYRLDTEIELSGFGIFLSAENPRIIYINILGELSSVYSGLCKKLGIVVDKPFIPHLTVCRLREKNFDMGLLGETKAPYGKFRVDHLSLFDSDLKEYKKIV